VASSPFTCEDEKSHITENAATAVKMAGSSSQVRNKEHWHSQGSTIIQKLIAHSSKQDLRLSLTANLIER
jgi:hypothetical protein